MADAVSARSAKRDTAEAIAECVAALGGARATFVLFFASPDHDGVRVARALREATGGEVLGCTTPAAYTDRGYGDEGISVIAFGPSIVRRAAVAIEPFGDVAEAVSRATKAVARAFGADLRALDPARHVGLVLTDPLTGPEAVNELLGHAAPFLSFVGGSAGDAYLMQNTRVYCNGESAPRGVALAVLELARPFAVVKATGFTSTGKRFRVTKAKSRTVYELDGAPAAQVFAEAVGVREDDLGPAQFMHHPLGVMIDGSPWVRSAILRTPSRGLVIGCALHEGTEVTLLASGNILDDTRASLDRARASLGGHVAAGLLFDCAYRRLELDQAGLMPAYREILRGFPLAGGHTFGESYLSHQNHTLIGLLFG